MPIAGAASTEKRLENSTDAMSGIEFDGLNSESMICDTAGGELDAEDSIFGIESGKSITRCEKPGIQLLGFDTEKSGSRPAATIPW